MNRFHFPWSRFPDPGEEAEVPGQGRRWRLWAGIGLGSLGVAAGVYGGWRWIAARANQDALVRAQGYMSAEDYRSAELTLEQLVLVNPGNLEARRALAEFFERIGQPKAVGVWRDAVALVPEDDGLKLSLAESALRFGMPAESQAALADLSGAGRDTLRYHQLAAGLALTRRDAAELKLHLEAMDRLDPGNPRTQISLAGLRLRSPDAAVAQAARAELETLARGDSVRIHATLALWMALGAADTTESLAALAARILPGFEKQDPAGARLALLNYLKAQPRPTADDAIALVEWLAVRGQAREALAWLDANGFASENRPELLAARAVAAVQLNDWQMLERHLTDGAWGKVNPDVVQLVFAARVERDRVGLIDARETFEDAATLAEPSYATLRMLDRLCGLWGWSDENAQVWERMIRNFPREPVAWRGLFALAEKQGATAEYAALADRRARALPGDLRAAALRSYALVLTRKTEEEARLRAAISVPAVSPPLPEVVAATAVMAARKGQWSEALELFARQPQLPKWAEHPRAAFVYGTLLTALRRPADAAPLLALLPAARQFPEEKALLRDAQMAALRGLK